ncbi:MAG: hypothetical protein HZA15_09160 [Nitrospirae bacterium]|nr:hypothetical protein [Nitrospirota bacterium]
MKIKDDIAKFIEYFEEAITDVAKVDNRLYKKILFACMLDALAIARFPKHNVEERIKSLLLNCTTCTDLNRVSLVQASLHLDHVLSVKEKADSHVFITISKDISKMRSGHVYKGSDVDPYYSQLEKLATEKEKSILKLSRYVDLFYAYRNEMVHGFKVPGYPFEKNTDDVPYYHGLIGEPWQLVFPVPFFQYLCEEALKGLKKYLGGNNINPYDQYEFGHMWVKSKKLLKIKAT